MSKISPQEVGSYAGGAVSVAASLTLTEVGIIVGIVTAILTFAINVWFKRRSHRSEEELRDLEKQKARLEIERLSQ